MPDWSSYRLSDFLMFEPETYYRLFQLYNRDLWPLALLALGLGVLLAAAVRRGGERWDRVALAGLALAWLWVGFAFHWRRYAPINLAAPWFAGGFAVQAVLLALAAWRPSRITTGRRRTLGAGLILYGVALQPVVGLLFGRDWTQAELAGMAPDPTTTITLGVLVALRGPWWLFPIPLLWCVATGLTLSAMQAPDAWLMPAVGLAAVAAAALGRGRAHGP